MFSIIIIIIFNLTVISLSMTPNDFCILNVKIQKNAICMKVQCDFDLCSSSKKLCNKIMVYWYMLPENFYDNINDCKSNEYVSTRNQICSIKETCKFYRQYELRQLLKPFNKLNAKPCACLSKLKYKCGENYCTDSKQSCTKLIHSLTSFAYVKHINKC